MSFAPCAVVPCYNHGAAVGAVVARLRAQGLPVIVVDDGSDAPTARVLDSLEGVQLIRHPRNAGKGAAVVRGLREAARLGFTHALQVDADGQHCLDDVPRFLERGRATPEAVICGEPIYDASAPRARLYGRLITRFWVWVETRGRARGDAMCGFRLYPLAPTVALLERTRLASGMSFDIEILVRLVWEGLPMEGVRTRVVYPEGGVSHFRMLRDNVRISATHTRLFFGSFFSHKKAHWSRVAERGSLWGLRFVAATARLLGRPAARIALLPAVAWFFLTGRDARRASRTYLSRLGAQSAPPTTWSVWRHMLTFADASLDKLAAWRGEIADQVAEAISAKAREGVRCNVILDALGSVQMERRLIRELLDLMHARHRLGAALAAEPAERAGEGQRVHRQRRRVVWLIAMSGDLPSACSMPNDVPRRRRSCR